jgi:cell wall-associated NlpC family hydrolase
MDKVPDWAGRYVGIPYCDYGRDQTGADCWGLVRLIWSEQCGLELPENAIDPNRGDLVEQVIRENIQDWFPIEAGKERVFDGVLMTGCYGEGRGMKRAGMHVGLVVTPGILIHTTEETDSAVLMRYRERLAGHDIIAFYRHRFLFHGGM